MNINQSTGVSTEFGYYPNIIDIVTDRFSIKTLPNLQESVISVSENPNVENGWIYPGAQQNIDFNGQTTLRPYNVRVFGMYKTHILTLHKNSNIDDLDFIVWCLSFFTGMRLTTSEAGFLDATTVKPGKLVDFVLNYSSLEDVINLALDYLEKERNNVRATKRIIAIIHSLFLAQSPQYLSFERFQYLYMGIDSCYKLVESKSDTRPKRTLRHAERVQWMCEKFSIPVPDWAEITGKNSQISKVRNDTMHEALFFDEPLGFSIYGGNHQSSTNQTNVILQMQHLICRLLVALLGKPESEYVKSRVDDRQKKGLNLRENKINK